VFHGEVTKRAGDEEFYCILKVLCRIFHLGQWDMYKEDDK